MEIRVEGRYAESGEPFTARLAVSADGVRTAREHKDLGLDRALKGLRFKRDVHATEVVLRISCERFCARADSMVAPYAAGEP